MNCFFVYKLYIKGRHLYENSGREGWFFLFEMNCRNFYPITKSILNKFLLYVRVLFDSRIYEMELMLQGWS